MPVTLYQQGSSGALRDLDYVNPRPPKQSSALPPDVRARLLGKKSGIDKTQVMEKAAVYTGASNAEPKKGKSGAGTDWVNPNGHAFVRRGSGVPLSQRASRAAQLSGASFELIKAQSQVEGTGGYGGNAGGYGGNARGYGGNAGGYARPLLKKSSSNRIGYADEGYARQSQAEAVSAQLLDQLNGPDQSAQHLDLGNED